MLKSGVCAIIVVEDGTDVADSAVEVAGVVVTGSVVLVVEVVDVVNVVEVLLVVVVMGQTIFGLVIFGKQLLVAETVELRSFTHTRKIARSLLLKSPYVDLEKLCRLSGL